MATNELVRYGEEMVLPANETCPRDMMLRIYRSPHSQGVVLNIPGFGRTSAEAKFAHCAAACAAKEYSSVGIDLGFGLPVAAYQRSYTLAQRVHDVLRVSEWVERQLGLVVRGLCAHSLGACVALEVAKELVSRGTRRHIPRLALLAPALNQQRLARYFMYRRWYKNTGRLSWADFVREWDEDSQNEGHFQTLAEYSPYLQEIAERDFCPEVARFQLSDHRHTSDRVFMVYATGDMVVPPESYSVVPRKRLPIAVSDHDLEVPQALEAWLPWVVEHMTRE